MNGHLDAGRTRTLSVALLLHSLELGGAQLAMLRLASGFAAEGCRVAVVLQKESAAAAFKMPPGIELVRLRADHVRSSVIPIARFANDWHPDVLLSALAHNNLAAVAASLLARRRFHVVVTEHAPLHHLIAHYGGWRYRVLPTLLRLLYPRASAIVGVSSGIADELKALVPAARHIEAIYNPIVDDAMLSASLEEANLPWHDDAEPLVLAVGRLASEKDHAALVRAFAVLRSRMPVRLAIAGEGPERAHLEALARELGLREEFALLGFSANPYALMRRASVLAMSSRFEGFGNVLVEALACGTPVVATDCPFGPREVIAGYGVGRLVPIGDERAMASALEQMIRSPPAEAVLTARAASFTVRESVKRYQALFAREVSSASAHRGI